MLANSARGVALMALREWRKGQAFAESVIHDLFHRSGLPSRDRAFAIELFYGVLRNRTLLNFWIDSLREGKLDAVARDLVALGLYQLFNLRTPDHAALYETVRLASKPRQGLINGILRAALRRREELRIQAKGQPIATRLSHPGFLIDRWLKNFGERAAIELCEWNNQPPPTYARLNRLKIDPEEFFRSHSQFTPLPNHPDFFDLSGMPNELLDHGLIYIQDPSTVTAVELLDPQAGETVLDACAAPGGKSSLIAQKMRNQGILVAADRDPSRITILRENVQRLGVVIAHPIRRDWIHINVSSSLEEFGAFDRIILDAPCSNTGVMRRRVDVRWRLRSDDFARLPEQQIAIARSLVPLLKENGILVYSTCSLEPEENEEIVVHLQNEFSQLELLEQKSILPFRDGFDGAFAAKLRKSA